MTFRRRLVLLSSAAVAIAVAAASAGAYVIVRSQLRGQVDAALRALAPEVIPQDADGRMPPILFTRIASISDTDAHVVLPADPLGGATASVQAVLPNGLVLRGRGQARLPVDGDVQAVARGTKKPFFRDATVNGTHVRIYVGRGVIGDALMLARPLTEVDANLRDLRVLLGGVGLAGILLAAGLGLLVARGTLAPVRRLTDTAEHVAATQDLSHRLDADPHGDELNRLSAAFNAMLTALQRSRDAQRQLVADASHELRTPLTSVRMNVELLANADRLPPAEQRSVLEASRRQLDELSVLVGDLVDTAREGPVPETELEDVRLDALVRDAVDRARSHAGDRELRFTSRPTTVRGSRPRLHRAVTNLLDNALKWGPPGEPIEVDVADGVVRVRDHGTGFSADDLPHVFDRFYRAPDARGLPGSGLGLAIVRQAAEAHGGTARAENAPDGGARLTLDLGPAAG